METQPTIEYRDLRHRPVDPNRARWYWLAASGVGILFAFLTIKTNWDYFAQYFSGWAFWLRIIPFFAVEGMIIVLPLFKGFGNKPQGNAAIAYEIILIVLAFTHTYLVSDSTVAKIQAGKTKTEASSDFLKTQGVIDRIKGDNQRAQETYNAAQANYNRSMAWWKDAALMARQQGRSIPAMPQPPQPPKLQDVPILNQSVVSNSTLSVETAGEARVSTQTLQALLFAMIGIVAFSITSLLLLADGSKIKAWLLGQRNEELKTQTQGQTKTLRSPAMSPPAQVAAQSDDFTTRSSKPGLLRRLLTR